MQIHLAERGGLRLIMMLANEKGRRRGDPIPKSVLADGTEFNTETLEYQARHLAIAFGMLPETASVVATLAFYGVCRP